MTDRIGSEFAPVNHTRQFREEMPGRTPEDAATTEIAVRNAVHTIGNLMRDERRRRAQAGLPELVLPADMAAAPRPGARAPRRARGTRGRAAALRPAPVHALWAVLFGAVILWPKWVLAGLFAGFLLCLAGVALFGPELLEHLRARALRMLRRRGTTRAERGARSGAPVPDRLARLRDLRG